ncbi:MAG: DegT/DnrJ/EryC1/StrS aminotransferase family protein [Chloroflexi bacterium]|nr:DegT/DnrJ/EryC1/StrS aminotransferase family protein [Chloroflexota bacterium]
MSRRSPEAVLTPVRAREDFLVFGAPQIEEAEIDEVVASMRAAWLGTGPKVARFEQQFREYKGASHAAAVNSCTAALHLSLLAAGVGPGDEVIAPSLTFGATVNAIIHTGATPILADIDPTSMNIDPSDLAARITDRTRAIVPVHFAGRPCEMDDIEPLVDRFSLTMIEDCAHAVETEYHGRKAGLFGAFGCFSFYATKNLTTGEGGMILTRLESDIARVRILALHGMSQDAWKRFSDEGYRHYQIVEAGFKYNMMDLQAAIGLHQLERLEENWVRRQAVWNRYQEAFAGLPLLRPAEPAPETRHGYHLYTIQIDEADAGITRDEVLEGMTAQGIGVGVHYMSIPEHPFYEQRYGWKPDDYPHSMRVGRQTLSLPLSARLTDRDVADVIEAVFRVVGRSSA